MTIKAERRIGADTLSIETGKLAKQALGAAVVRYGDTVVLGTVITADPRPGIDFFPLMVDYREKMSAAGKFPGGRGSRQVIVPPCWFRCWCCRPPPTTTRM